MKTKKKKKVFTRIYSSFLSAGQKQRSLPTIRMLKAFAQLTKGGHFAILHTYLGKLYYPGDPKGGHGPMPPPKYAPACIAGLNISELRMQLSGEHLEAFNVMHSNKVRL